MSVQGTEDEGHSLQGHASGDQLPAQRDWRALAQRRQGVFIPVRVLVHTAVVVVAGLTGILVALVPNSDKPVGTAIAVAALLYALSNARRGNRGH